MTELAIEKDKLRNELDRIVDHLEQNNPVQSHVWLTFCHPDLPSGSWTLDDLNTFLTLFAKKESGAEVHAVWGQTDTSPVREGNGMVMNMTGFMVLCNQVPDMADKHHEAVLTIIAGPWHPLIEADPTVLRDIQMLIVKLVPETAKYFLPYNNDEKQKEEYASVFSALEKGSPVLSHWCLFLSYEGDAGGDHWTPERLRGCLEAMRQGKRYTVKSVWLAEPDQSVDPDQEKMVFNNKGEHYAEDVPDYLTTMSMINLTDFIWACCQQKKIINSPLIVVVAALASYPFVGMTKRNNPDAWLEKTIRHLKNIHRATTRVTRH